ncbi:hypothetical protein JCM3774_002429 [Rhodotorula dairenensis]
MAKRPRCPVCRSKRWHRDGLSGAVVCEEGHLLAGYVQETTEAQEGPSQHTQTTRRIRKNRTRKQKPPANDHFHGDRERFLLWQAMQLILREQLRVLIDELGWPVELEAVTRDLWSLLVASSGERAVPAAPRDYHLDDEPAASYSGPRKGDRYNRAGRNPYGTRGVKKEDSDRAGPGGVGGGDGDDDGGDGQDPPAGGRSGGRGDDESRGGSGTDSERDTAPRAAAGELQSDEDSDADSYFSEDQDADDERAPPTSKKRRSRRPSPADGFGAHSAPGPGGGGGEETSNARTGWRSFGRGGRYPAHKRRRVAPPPPRSDDPRDQPRLEYTLLVIYLACITLKLPIMLGDLFHLADTYQILYLDAVLHLPANMQAHLPKRSRDLLSPSSTPHLCAHNISFERLSPDDAGTVQGTLARLVGLYREDWRVEFPEANGPLLLARICHSWLALPPRVYCLALALLSHLPSPPSFHLPVSLQLSRVKTGPGTPTGGWPRQRTGSQDWRVALPEIKLSTIVVVLCRLLWDLDGDIDKQDPHEENSSTSKSSGPLAGVIADLPSRDDWLDAIERLSNLAQPGDPSPLWTQEVVDMRGDEIDRYLDFFESRIVSQEKVPSRMDNVSRFFPPPFEEDLPEKNMGSPQDFFDRASAIFQTLYAVPKKVQAGPIGSAGSGAAALSSLFPAASGQQSSAFCTADLPRPLTRLLAVLACRLTPLPTSLRINLRGPAPLHETTGIANFLPFLDQVERALVSTANASTTAEQHWNRTRDLPREAKKQAEQERRNRLKREKERRRAVDRLRCVSQEANAESDTEEEAMAGAQPAIKVRLEDQYGREIAMARSRARTVKSKNVIDSQDDMEAAEGMEVAAAARGLAEP